MGSGRKGESTATPVRPCSTFGCTHKWPCSKHGKGRERGRFAGPDEAVDVALEQLLGVGVRHGDHLREVNERDHIVIAYLHAPANAGLGSG